VRGGRTVLAHSYAEPPFRLGRTFDLQGAAYAIIVCSGPGVFGGDVLRQTVHVARGARVVLTSQAALQVHPSPNPSSNPAILQSTLVVEDDAELHGHWDPVIPFAGARLEQQFDLRIAASSGLYWGDAVMAGRVSRGEVWQFASLSHELGLRVGGSLAYMERYTLDPRERALDQPWTAGRAGYFATSLVHHAGATGAIAERWQRTLAAAPDAGFQAGIDLVAPRLIAARVTAADGARFGRFRAAYRAAALEDIFRSPELAGRK